MRDRIYLLIMIYHKRLRPARGLFLRPPALPSIRTPTPARLRCLPAGAALLLDAHRHRLRGSGGKNLISPGAVNRRKNVAIATLFLIFDATRTPKPPARTIPNNPEVLGGAKAARDNRGTIAVLYRMTFKRLARRFVA